VWSVSCANLFLIVVWCAVYTQTVSYCTGETLGYFSCVLKHVVSVNFLGEAEGGEDGMMILFCPGRIYDV